MYTIYRHDDDDGEAACTSIHYCLGHLVTLSIEEYSKKGMVNRTNARSPKARKCSINYRVITALGHGRIQRGCTGVQDPLPWKITSGNRFP